jgi:hypothetical protein
MSLLGSIGHFIKVSGLEEVLGETFGPNTVYTQFILSGKAYARSVQKHFSIQIQCSSVFLSCHRVVQVCTTGWFCFENHDQ